MAISVSSCQVQPSPTFTRLLTAFPGSIKQVAESTVELELAATPAPLISISNPDWPLLLNDRECTTLRLLAAGDSHKLIAKAIRLSPSTIRWYMQSLYSKLQVSNRTETINRAREVRPL